jgi:hypothetical protein
MDEARKSNRAFLLRVWASPLLGLTVSLLAIAFTLRAGAGASLVYPLLGSVAVAVAFVAGARVWLRRHLLRLLASSDPDALIESMQRRIGRARVPQPQLLVACSTAFYRALYGQFGRALDALDERSWRDAPALYRASMLQNRALVSFLSREDVEAGLRAAEEARALAEVPGIAPGAATNRRTSETYVEIGCVLTGRAQADAAEKLQAQLSQIKNPTERVVALWAAALAHERAERHERALPLLDEIRRIAPHCAPLHDVSLDTRSAAPAVDGLPSMCASHPDVRATCRCVRCGSFACGACERRVSEQASLCRACCARYRELRETQLGAESSLRSAGLVAQGLGLACVPVAFALGAFMLRTPGTIGLVGSVLYLSFGGVSYWLSGRRLRHFQVGWRRRLLLVALPVLAIAPLGTAGSAYLLWLAYGPHGRAMESLDYERAIGVTPELSPRLVWGRASLALSLMLLNLVMLVLLVSR